MASDTITLRLFAQIEHEFAVGEQVALLSGGPAMTVLKFCEECGDTDVAWFIDDEIEILTLPAAALRPWQVS